MSDLNNIEKLFQDKLQNFEIPVRAELWDKVAAGAGIGKTVFWTGTKTSAAVVVGLVAVASLSWLLFDSNVDANNFVDTKTTQQEPAFGDDQAFLPEHNASTESNAALEKPIVAKPAVLKEKQTDGLPPQTPESHPRANYNASTTHEIAAGTQGSETFANELPTSDDKVQTSTEMPVFSPAPTETLNLEILYAPEKTEEKSLEQIHFPQQFVQVFNPNLPGENGQFTVYSENLGSFKIEIKTRAGKLVFTSTDPNFVWRGEQMDGSQAPEGTYMYTIFSTTMNGESIKRAGSVFLMRK